MRAPSPALVPRRAAQKSPADGSDTLSREAREGSGLWLDGRIGIESSNPLPLCGGGWPAAGAFTSRGGPGEGVENTLPNL